MSISENRALSDAIVQHRAYVFVFCVAFALLLAYLSFIPFLYRPLPLDEAIQRFARLPYLHLGSESRADWVANICMYVPLGWLLARLLQPAPSARIDLAVLFGAFVIGTGWAVAIEFAQLYFPGRTASLNDLIAEAVGTFIGAALWLLLGRSSLAWWRRILLGGKGTARAALTGYAIAYLILSVAPYDFVISWRELSEHVDSPLVDVWLASTVCGPVPCSVRLGFEGLLTAPLGLWWAMRGRRSLSIGGALIAGGALGLFLEAMQLLLVSGVSQGASVVARAVGFAVGTMINSQRDRLASIDLRRHGRTLVLAGALPFLWAVTYVNGWWSGHWMDLAAGWARVDDVRWLPFYYQYFTTEQDAIRSGIVHSLLYMPVGAAAWLWTRQKESLAPAMAAATAAAIAAIAEFGKLFIEGRHPDLTDVMIAAVIAGLAASLLRAISRPGNPDEVRPETVMHQAGGNSRRFGDTTAATVDVVPGLRIVGGLALVLAALSLFDFPVSPQLLAALMALYALVLVRFPLIYLWIVPVALPMLDLAQYSGRLFWDEFDVLLLVTFGVRFALGLPVIKSPSALPRFVLVLLVASVATSTVVALTPVAPLDANAFSSYLSPYNALRIAKGYLWGVAFLWLVATDASLDTTVAQRLAQGLALAFLAVAASVIWERTQFAGLFAFDTEFRVAGPVSAMHVGGAYLDALLLTLFPFVLMLALRAPSAARRSGWAVVAVLGFYAIVVTFSRATLVAWFAGTFVFAMLWVRRARYLVGTLSQHARSGRHAATAVLTALCAAVLIVMASPTLRDRFSAVPEDAGIRFAHWRSVLEMISFDLPHTTFGMGLGAFPRHFHAHRGEFGNPTAYRFESDLTGKKQRLVLEGGSGLFILQRVAVAWGADVRVDLVAHAGRGGPRLTVALCETTLVYSARCAGEEVDLDPRGGVRRLSLQVPTAQGTLESARPIVLSLHSGSPGLTITIESVSVRDGDGAELIRNGDFTRGADHWFFVSDDHLAWHTKNAPLQVLFEMGLLGVFAWSGMAIAVLRRLVMADSRSALVPAVGASMIGLLILIAVDSVIDAPRFIVLVLLLALFPLDSGSTDKSEKAEV